MAPTPGQPRQASSRSAARMIDPARAPTSARPSPSSSWWSASPLGAPIVAVLPRHSTWHQRLLRDALLHPGPGLADRSPHLPLRIAEGAGARTPTALRAGPRLHRLHRRDRLVPAWAADGGLDRRGDGGSAAGRPGRDRLLHRLPPVLPQVVGAGPVPEAHATHHARVDHMRRPRAAGMRQGGV